MSSTVDVLVVEDEIAIRNLIAFALEREGYTVKTAAGAFEALYYLEKHPAPGLILLDLSLGMTDGQALRERQQASPELASIPVVLVSGSSELQERARELDASAYLPKPVNVRHLRELVKFYCGPREAVTLSPVETARALGIF